MRRLSFTEIFGFAAIVVLALRKGGMAGDPGVGWHIATGLRTILRFEIPRTDPFLYPSPTSQWVHTQWLGDVIFAVIYAIGSWPALELVTIVIGWLICFLLLPRGLKYAGQIEAFLGVFAALLLFSVQWFLRPVIFSFLFFTILFRLLNPRFKVNLRFVPLLFLLWANIHPAFVLGFLILGARVISDFVNKKEVKGIMATASLSLLATFINPYGLSLHMQIIGLAADRYFQNLNSEWLSPIYMEPTFFPHFIVSLIVLWLCLKPLLVGPNFYEKLSALVFLVMSLNGRRYIPFFSIPAAYVIAYSASHSVWLTTGTTMERIRQRFSPKLSIPLSGIALYILVFYVAITKHFPGRTAYDSSMEAFLPNGFQNDLKACRSSGGDNIFASPNYGGAISFLSEGNLHPFIDDRNELNGKERYQQYFEIMYAFPGWKKRLENEDCVLLVENAPLQHYLDEKNGWRKESKTLYVRTH